MNYDFTLGGSCIDDIERAGFSFYQAMNDFVVKREYVQLQLFVRMGTPWRVAYIGYECTLSVSNIFEEIDCIGRCRL